MGLWNLTHCDSTHYEQFIKEVLIDDKSDEWLVDYETVGQYTGQNVGTDTKVFHGDILKFEDTESEFVDVGLGYGCGCKVAETVVYNFAEVVFKNGCFGLDIKCTELYENRFISFNELIEVWDEDFFKNAEVIGNIYDNKELLND